MKFLYLLFICSVIAFFEDEQQTQAAWDLLYSKFANSYGVAGLMGNLAVEPKFKKSVGDLELFVKELEDDYSLVYHFMKSSRSVKEASDFVLSNYFKSSDHSEESKNKRISQGEKLHQKFAGYRDSKGCDLYRTNSQTEAYLSASKQSKVLTTLRKRIFVCAQKVNSSWYEALGKGYVHADNLNINGSPLFKPRRDEPEKGNPYYTSGHNGYLSNFYYDLDNIRYAIGRFNEIMESKKSRMVLDPAPGVNHILVKAQKAGLKVSNTPSLGALAVFTKLDNTDGVVAVVEEITDNGIVTSEMEPGNKFSTNERSAKKNYNPPKGFEFRAFIKNPGVK